jgi:hypothetical protein
MKIIKNSLYENKKSEFGNFEILPEEGWEISEAFKDFESGLLVIRLCDNNKNNWEDLGHGERRIPIKQFIIHLETLEILSPSEWSKYFNYEKVTFQTDDNKFILTTQRIHKPEENTDSIYEELEALDTKYKCTSKEIAFSKEKRENLLENHYRSIKEMEERKKIFEAKPTLDAFYLKQLDTLEDNNVIFGYCSEINTYKLVFSNSKYILFRGGKLSEPEAWKYLTFDIVNTYFNLDEFWNDFTKDEKWYLNLWFHWGLSEKPLLLAKYIIKYFNDLRKEHKFTFDEYDRINDWQNSVWSDEYKETEIKQWCSNCYQEVYYQGRYPKYICHNCASKEIYDNDGNFLEFLNIGMFGGFRIIRKNKEREIIEEDTSQNYCDCIIDDKLFFAQEARFGGIVIQKKE